MNRAESIDIEALEADLNALRDELKASVSDADRHHFTKMNIWGRLSTLLGYATAWIAPNPFSAFLISTGIFARWAMIAHHVTHRGYDKVPDMPERYTSKHFAKGWRRFLDWSDWLDPEAWRHEHNTLHHYKLGEVHDPDQPEHNLEWLRSSSLPMFLRYIVVFIGAATWKIAYYPPNTMRSLHKAELRRNGESIEDTRAWDPFDLRAWSPFRAPGSWLWIRCYIPYVLLHFVLIPLPFYLISPWAWASVLINRMLAEILTNLHAFLVIVPNHAGDDLYRFDTPIEGRGDFYLRQIVGSTNYRTGSDLNDFMHGYLNYQIEHHLWPDLSMLQYQHAQTRVAEICEKHGVPYVQESVFKRLKKLVDILVGKATMPRWPESLASSSVAPVAEPL